MMPPEPKSPLEFSVNSIFLPAIALMNRLRFPQKFLLMGAMLAVVMALLMANLYSALDASVQSSRKQLAGLSVVQTLSSLVKATQEHRGLSSGVLGGNAGMKEALATKTAEVQSHADRLEQALPQVLAGSQGWQTVRADWGRIRSEGLGLEQAVNFSRHTELIDRMLNLMADIADEYRLTVDPDIDSHYLMLSALDRLPAALEQMGQLRAIGTGVLARKALSDELKIQLAGLVAGVDRGIRQVELNLEKTARFNPHMRQALTPIAAQLASSMQGIRRTVSEDMIGGRYSVEPPVFFQTVTQAMSHGYKGMFETLMPALGELVERRVDSLQKRLWLIFGVSAALIVLLLYFAVAISLATIGSVARLSGVAETIATGDLRPRIQLDTRDELAVVGKSLNHMADAFSNLLHSAQASVGRVLDASLRLSGSSDQIARSSEEQSSSATSMAAAVEQMTVGIEQVSRNATQADEIAEEAGALSAGGGQIVRAVVTDIEKIAATVNRSAEFVDQLGSQSEKISAIVNVIKEIADQTNLLALNAAIEAARAGESGRGFAVVADEVRKLAERTAQSTDQISVMIGSIQGGTRSAVGSMREGVAQVNAGVEQAKKAGEAMTGIQGNAGKVAEAVVEISNSLREQSAASVDIAKNVERIAQMAEQNSMAVRENNITAQDLKRLAEHLNSEIGRFRTS
jgi:methyl-accepting chemotaxis protein